jgi:DNA-binding beta-propeller fold protein YncE
VSPSSPTFQQVVARIPLEKLTNGPVAGQPVTGKETRSVGITPDGQWAFVSHGGDGRVSVIDTAAKRVARTLELPTPMKGGGYLAAVQLGARLVDPSAR